MEILGICPENSAQLRVLRSPQQQNMTICNEHSRPRGRRCRDPCHPSLLFEPFLFNILLTVITVLSLLDIVRLNCGIACQMNFVLFPLLIIFAMSLAAGTGRCVTVLLVALSVCCLVLSLVSFALP